MPDSTDPIHVMITTKLDDDLLDAVHDVSDRIEVIYHPAQQAEDVPDDRWAEANVLYTLNAIPVPAKARKHPHIADLFSRTILMLS